MHLRHGIKLLLFGVLVSNIQSSAVMPRAAADPTALIEASVKAYELLISNLKEGVGGLFIGDIMTRVASSLSELSVTLDKKQKDALEVIFKINKDSLQAIDGARVVVVKLHSIVKLAVYAVNYEQSKEMYLAAIQVFLTSSDEVLPEVKTAIDKIVTVIADSAEVDASFTALRSWVALNKANFEALSTAEKEQARSKAYGGAVSCVVFGPLAIFACPIAYGIAIGVTEGKSVKDIEASFDKGIQELNNMQNHIQALSKKTNKLVNLVKSDYTKLVTIQTHLVDANAFSEAIIKVSFNVYFVPFKKSVTTLDNLCQAYLGQNPLVGNLLK